MRHANDDGDYTLADAHQDALQDGFTDWCDDHDTNPDDNPDAWDQYIQDLAQAKDPYAFYGLTRTDFR